MFEYKRNGRRSSGAGFANIGQMWRTNPIGQLEQRIQEWSGWDKTEKWEMVLKRILYIVGFAGLVLIDQIMLTGNGGEQLGLRNYTGVVMGFVILTAYRLKDFLRLSYGIWTLVFFTARYFILQWAQESLWEHAILRLNTALWLAGVYGVIVIRMVYLYLVERRKPKMNWGMFALWLFLMLWMVIVGRQDSTDTWPISVLVFFGLFYLTNFRERDLNNLYSGIAEGIIIGFLIVQGRAILYRPYDTVRYQGMYRNPNHNALFYLFSYCGVLCKWYQMKLRKYHILFRLPMPFLAGGIFSLALMTGGRAAVFTMLLITVFFLVFQALARKRRKLPEMLVDLVILGVAVVVCFQPAYKAIRYVPARVDEPLYFEQEDVNIKIQQGDPVDAERYTEYEEMLEECFGRVLWFLEEEVSAIVPTPDWKWLLGPALQVQASDWYDVYWYPEDTMYMEPGCDSRHPILLPEEYGDPVKIRMAIWQYFFKELNLTGVHEKTAEPWITKGYQAPHAHNFFLQMAYEFGWPVGVLLLIIAVQLFNRGLFGIGERKSGAWYYRLFVTLSFAIVQVVFGMLEYNWFFGELSLTMFFFIQYVLHHKSDVSKKAIESR